MLNYTRIELEATGCETIAAAWVATVEDRHIVFLCHSIDGIEKTQEVLLGVNVFLTVSAEEDVFALLQSKTLVNIAGLYLCKVLVKNLSHRRARDIGPFLRKSTVGKITACVLAVGHIHIGNYIHNPAIGLLWKAFVLAAVTGFHMENRDMQSLGADYAEATIGITEYQNSVRLGLYHQFVTLCYDVTHRFTKIGAYCIHIYLRVSKFEIFEEDSVEVVVVVLAGMGKDYVEVFAAFVDYCCKTDDFRAGADNYQEFEFAVILKLCHCFSILLGQRKYPVFPD